MSFNQLLQQLKGRGRGNWGHSGRPGMVGGSTTGSGGGTGNASIDSIDTSDVSSYIVAESKHTGVPAQELRENVQVMRKRISKSNNFPEAVGNEVFNFGYRMAGLAVGINPRNVPKQGIPKQFSSEFRSQSMEYGKQLAALAKWKP